MVDKKEVQFKDALKYAKAHGAHYFETSAKEGINVSEMF